MIASVDTHDEAPAAPAHGWPAQGVVARALVVLLAVVGLGDLWTADGPTDRAANLYLYGGRRLRGGRRMFDDERALLFAAFALWTGEATKARFVDVVWLLNERQLRALVSLVLACLDGDAAVEAWIVATQESAGGAR